MFFLDAYLLSTCFEDLNENRLQEGHWRSREILRIVFPHSEEEGILQTIKKDSLCSKNLRRLGEEFGLEDRQRHVLTRSLSLMYVRKEVVLWCILHSMKGSDFVAPSGDHRL